MHYYEVMVADGSYHSEQPLIYSFSELLAPLSVVSISLRNKLVTGFILRKVNKPEFRVKPIKSLMSSRQLPRYCIKLAEWISDYYAAGFGESLRQFAPTRPSVRKTEYPTGPERAMHGQMQLDAPLTSEQKAAIKKIVSSPTSTVLLHGDTGSGKTRVYLELAEATLRAGKSVIILTPEIALTSQLEQSVRQKLNIEPMVLHSQLKVSERKKLWLKALESDDPMVVIGPRSALFTPLQHVGLIIVDESHEPAYKQEQSPRYHAVRVASYLGNLTEAKVILGSATPALTDYYLARQREAIVTMSRQAKTGQAAKFSAKLVDIKDRSNFSSNPYLSDELISAVKEALKRKRQALIYFNRRGTARLIMCSLCGWQLHCPNCDIPLTYHADTHNARCHICGYRTLPPPACMNCKNPDVIYKSIGTKALVEMVSKIFQGYRIARFDSDNTSGERIEELYPELLEGKVDVVVGTQILAKGFDLPRLGVVGVVSAETSVALPDFAAEERTFQLLYQVIGRVGRGHGDANVIIQTYHPESRLLKAALERDYKSFYQYNLDERKAFKFPPYSYLARLSCHRKTLTGAEEAAARLKDSLTAQGLPVEIIGPSPSFYEKRGKEYWWQIILKSKDRELLTRLAGKVPSGWSVDLDPVDLL